MNYDAKDIKVCKDEAKTEEVTTGFIGSNMIITAGGIDYRASVVGDFDGDGKATQVELTNIIRHIVGLTGAELTGVRYESGDITGDGLVDQRDLTKLIRYITTGELDLGKKDENPPVISLTTKDVEQYSAKVVATAIDKESGMGDNPTFTFYIKKKGEPDSSYVQKYSGTNNELTLDGLTPNTEYEIKVETQDVAGNKGEKTITFTTKKVEGKLVFSNETWSSGTATVIISTDTNYQIEYQINATTGTWIKGPTGLAGGTQVTINSLNHNDVIYARLTDGTTPSDTQNKTVEDDKEPELTLNLTGTTSSIDITVAGVDNETGIDSTEQYVYYIKESSSSTYTELTRTTNTHYITTGLKADTNYMIKVEIKDKAGNVGTKEQSITTKNVPDAGNPGSIIFSKIVWNSGETEVTISTNTEYQIEYQVNGTSGIWTKGPTGLAGGTQISVGNLNHNDKIYARLTDGTNAGKYATLTIIDNIKPEVTLTLTDDGVDKITATVVATDNESGIDTAATYIFYLKETGADDSTYVHKQTSTSKTCDFPGLTVGVDYTVKVEVADKAGNVGMKEESRDIPDNIAPTVGVTITGTTTNTLTAKATATDAGGLPSPTIYVFYIKKTGEPDTSYVQKQNTSSDTCTFTGLDQNTEYTIKVEVADAAGNVGTKEASGLTGTIPSGTTAGAITFTNISWTSGKATVTIKTNTNYQIEYQVNGVAGSWIKGPAGATGGTQVIANNLNHNDIIYARLTDGTNSSSPATCTILDSIKPQVTLSLTSKISEITATANAIDNETGIDTAATYIFSIKEASQPDTSYVQKQATTSKTCTITELKQNTTYVVKVEVHDRAGNIGTASQSTLTATMPSGTSAGAITFSSVTWSSGKASVTISTNTEYQIEYQVNGVAGTWIKGPVGAIGGTQVLANNLNHNDIVYARLTDGTNAGKYATLTITDTIAPQNFTINVTDITYEGFKITGNTVDNESGLKDYTFVVAKKNSGKTVSVSSIENTKITQNITKENTNSERGTQANENAGEQSYNINRVGNYGYSDSNISNRNNVTNATEVTGLFSKTREAREKYNMAKAKEELQLEIADIQLEVMQTESREATLNDMYAMLREDRWSTELYYDPIASELGIITKPTYAKVSKTNTPYIFTVDEKLVIRDVELGKVEVKLIEFGEEIWNEGKAEIDLSTKADGTIEYKVGERETEYKEGTKVQGLLNGDTIYARINKDGQCSEEEKYTIVDKEKPEEFTIATSNITTTGLNIAGSTVDKQSGLFNYTYIALKSETETTVVNYTTTNTSYDVTGLEMGTEYVVYMLATDNAGNVRKSSEETITTKIDEDSIYNNITIKLSDESWTKDDISVEVDWGISDGSNIVKEISLDGGSTYKKYIGSETLGYNTTVKAKLTISGKEIIKDKPVTNIDKLQPNTFNVTVTDTTSSTAMSINANTTDKEATNQYAISGIKGYKYYIYQGETLISSSDIIKSSYAVSNLVAGQTYKIYAIAYDNADNSIKSEEMEYKKLCVWKVYQTNAEVIDYEIELEPFERNFYNGYIRGYTLPYNINDNVETIKNTAKANLIARGDGDRYFRIDESKWKTISASHSTYNNKVQNLINFYNAVKNKIIVGKNNGGIFDSKVDGNTYNPKAANEVYYFNGYDTTSFLLKGYHIKQTNRKIKYTKQEQWQLGYIKSENIDTYPEDGEQGGYWYEKV